jgi:GNAT superfamily N-acetyltransferase
MRSRPLDLDLEREIRAAQSVLPKQAAAEAERLEWAQFATCRAVAEALALREPSSGAGAYVSSAGAAIFAGNGSPLTQGMAMGLRGAVAADDLEAVEAHLRPTGAGRRQLEVSAFADPSLHALLAERGYRVNEWQLVWTRPVPRRSLGPPAPGLTIRRVLPGEEELYCRVVLAGALETESVPQAAISLLLPFAFAAGYELHLAWLGGEAIGAATLCFADGIAFVNGCAVRPAFRGRGAHGSLIRARLDRAREVGFASACSSTMPGTASHRNIERHGFSFVYPKVVMIADDRLDPQ